MKPVRLTLAWIARILAITLSTLSDICWGDSPGVSPGGHLGPSASESWNQTILKAKLASQAKRGKDRNVPLSPDVPSRMLLPDILRQHSLVFPIIPLSHFGFGRHGAFVREGISKELIGSQLQLSPHSKLS